LQDGSKQLDLIEYTDIVTRPEKRKKAAFEERKEEKVVENWKS